MVYLQQINIMCCMMNVCTVCQNNFEAKRTDAKFCSSTCRSKASRIMTKRDVDELQGNINHPVSNPEEELVPAPEILQKEAIQKYANALPSEFDGPRKKTARMIEAENGLMTPHGQMRQQWDPKHPIENLEGGYLHIGQSASEYIENITERGFNYDGTRCEHPVSEQLYSRCLHCGDMIPWVQRHGKPLVKGTKKK
jgi:hypothetical protein